MKKIILQTILILIGIGFIISIAFSFDLESRTYFWRISESGFVIFLGMSLLLVYFVFVSFLNAKVLRGIFLLLPLVLVSTCTVMSTGMYPEYEDRAIYASENNNMKLIIQYYETGITGNPRKRLIKVEDENKDIRPYKLLENKWIPDTISFETTNWKNLLPDILKIEDETYKLEKVNDLYE